MKGRILILALLLGAASASAQEAWRDTTATDTGGRVIFKEGSFVQPVTKRDSILVADRLLYGFELNNVPDSTVLAFPQIANPYMQDVLALPMWQVDTLKVQKIKANNTRLDPFRRHRGHPPVRAADHRGLYDARRYRHLRPARSA